MSVTPLQRVTLVGLATEKERVLEELQQLGALHLIPLSAEGLPLAGGDGPSREARQALDFLLSCPRPRTPATRARGGFDALAVERQALELKHRKAVLVEERDALLQRIEDLEPWGAFEFAPLAELDGNRLWFYAVPHRLMDEVEASGLAWDVVHVDSRTSFVCVVAPDEPDPARMPVPRTHAGARSLDELHTRLEEVRGEIEDANAKRESLSRWSLLYARSLDRLEEAAARQAAARATFDDADLFALEAWVPVAARPALEAYAAERGLALELRDPRPDEEPPTRLANPPPLRAGEDLVQFYQTPGYWIRDPSSVVFVSFAVFFGMIVADCGYGALLMAATLLGWRRMGATERGRSWRVLCAWLSGSTMLYGTLVGSYFGVTPPAGSLLGRLHVFDLHQATSMMALSVVVGATHIVLANVQDALRYGRDPRRFVPLGWAALVGGATVFGLAQAAGQEPLATGGAAVAGLGLVTAMAFAGHGERPLKRVVAALGVVTGLSGAFGDVMSYLRLFALGLASASLAVAFNDMAAGIREALPGVGILFALLVLLLGHALNLTLALASGFIHGLRLNVIEYFKHGVKAEGVPFRAFARKETS